MSNGNVNTYIQSHPHCDRSLIVSLWFDRLHILFPTSNLLFKLQQVSIGLSYLHSQNVIHGSIRGSNILIGNEGRAVLAEFGLTRLKVEVCTLAPTESSTPQNWMALELFMGSPVSMKSDVYAFGLVIYEVCCSWTCLCLFRFSIILRWKVMANEIPFGNVPSSMVRNLVVARHQRPSRPTIAAAPQLSVDIWRLARRCWSRWEFRRPTAQAIAKTLTLSLHSFTPTQSKSDDGADNSFTQKPPPASPAIVSQLAYSLGELMVDILEDGPSATISHFNRILIASGYSTTTDSIMSEAYERCLTISLPGPVSALHLSLNGRSLLVGSRAGVSQWDCLDGVRTPVIPPFTGPNPITAFTFGDYTNRSAFALDERGTICRLVEGKTGNAPFFNTTPITCISASTAVMVAFSAQSRKIYKWDLDTSENPKMATVTLTSLRTGATCAAFSRYGHLLFVGDGHGSLSIWISKTGQPQMRPLDYTMATANNLPRSTSSNVVRCVSILPSPSSKHIAVVYDTGEIRLWDLETRTCSIPRSPLDVLQPSRPPNEVKAIPMFFSSDGKILVFPSLDKQKTIEFFNTKRCTTSTTHELDDWPDGAVVRSILVSPDKTRLIIGFEGFNDILIFCWPGRAWYPCESFGTLHHRWFSSFLLS